MSMTLVELKNKLKRLDETILCEILNITSEELVDRFEDLIEEHFDELEEDLDDEDFETD
jgi:hypothetical protein